MEVPIIKCLAFGALIALLGCSIREPGSPMEYRQPSMEPVELWSIKESVPLKENPQRFNLLEGPMEFLGIKGTGVANYVNGKPHRINHFQWSASYVDTTHFEHARDTILHYFRSRYGPEQIREVDTIESDVSGFTLFWTLPFDSAHTYDEVISVSVVPALQWTRYSKILHSPR